MKYGKYIIILVLAVFLLSMSSVCASEIDDTIASDDINDIGLSADDEIEDNLQTNDENSELTLTDTDILGADSATYSDLAAEIAQSGNIKLKHKNYTYDTGATAITITEENKVIDGDGAVIDMARSSNMQAFYAVASGVTIKNLTIKNSNSLDEGGAILFKSSGTVTNCNFTDNSARYGGAVLFEGYGNVTNCNFVGNNASRTGGAVYFYSTGTVSNCNFTNNTANTGGAIRTASCNVTNCNFTNNTASDNGGAGYFMDNVGVTNCNFTNNTASCDGGAVYLYDTGNVRNCNFTNNTAYNGGAVLFHDNREYIVTNCNFTNNTASQNGGALYFNNIGNVSNCIFSGNYAKYGGAIFSRGNNTVTVDRCLFKTSSDTTYPVSLTDPELNIKVDNVTEGSNATITITTNSTFNGKVTVIIGDKNYTVTLVNGIGSCNITGLKAGTYTATVILKQTDKFQATNKTTNFTVKSKENQTLIDPELNIKVDNITEGSNATILINTNKTYNGEVTVKIGDKNYTVPVINGEGSCNITGLKAGTYTATVILKQTDKFQATNKTTNFTVKSKENPILVDPGLNINIDNITEGSNATILINTDKTYNGEVTVKIGDKTYSVTLVNSIGSCNITGLKAGTYTATVILKQTDKFQATNKTINFTVKNKLITIIKSSAVTTTYATSKNIIITLTDTQGKALAGKKVTVVLNGVPKILTTNNKGQSIMATGTTLLPKTYKVSFKFTGDNIYLGSSGSVNLVVKKSTPKITAKNKNYKAKTKNKKYTITLKNDKKQAIKNTKLTLKVNGKTYTAKTNNKGKAIFEIKKLTKKGKYKTTITFKANQYYNKITTKTTITIK